MRPASLFIALIAVLLAPATLRAGAPATVVHVDVDDRLGPANLDLVGVGWNSGSIKGVHQLRPATVRIDSRLERVSPAPGELRLDDLLERVAQVRAQKGDPLVILYATPAWLGEPRVGGCSPPPFVSVCDPIRLAPADLDAWEELIVEVVRRLATAATPAYRFEVWNEPDTFVFWHDTPEAFLETAIRTHRAVARVEVELGIDLEIGGPAGSLTGPLVGVESGRIEDYAAAIRDAGLPLDFVSWHWYGNTPFLGPDGNEGCVPEEIYEVLGRINPFTTPAVYGVQTETHRALLDTVLAGSGLAPALMIDEWNISACGLDLRHDSNEGAAYVAASLIEMERAGLDRAAYYRWDGDFGAGDWALVSRGEKRTTRKSAYWLFHRWPRLHGDRLAVSGDDPADGLWARATRQRHLVDVLLVNWRAVDGSARDVDLELVGGCSPRRATVRSINAESASFRMVRPQPAMGNSRMHLSLPEQSVYWVRASCTVQ
jgi:hypothetical protein